MPQLLVLPILHELLPPYISRVTIRTATPTKQHIILALTHNIFIVTLILKLQHRWFSRLTTTQLFCWHLGKGKGNGFRFDASLSFLVGFLLLLLLFHTGSLVLVLVLVHHCLPGFDVPFSYVFIVFCCVGSERMANFGSVYFVDHKNQTNSYNLLQITRVYALEFLSLLSLFLLSLLI